MRSDLFNAGIECYKCSDIARDPVFTSCLKLFKKVACVTNSTERFNSDATLQNIVYFDSSEDAYNYCSEEVNKLLATQ